MYPLMPVVYRSSEVEEGLQRVLVELLGPFLQQLALLSTQTLLLKIFHFVRKLKHLLDQGLEAQSHIHREYPNSQLHNHSVLLARSDNSNEKISQRTYFSWERRVFL